MARQALAAAGLSVCLFAWTGRALADTTYTLVNGTVTDTYTPYPLYDGTVTGTLTLSPSFLVTAANLTYTPEDGSPTLSGFSIVTQGGYDPGSSYVSFGVQTASALADHLYLYVEVPPDASGALTVCGDPNPCPAFFNDASSYLLQPVTGGISDFGGSALLVPTPEPSSLLLLGTGVLSVLGLARRLRAKAEA